MSARAEPVQQYFTDRRGRRYPVHTTRLRDSCRCNTCHQRRWWTPARRAARSEQLARQYADGSRRRTGEQNRRRGWCWTDEQDDALRALAGAHDCATIARMLSDRFGHPRSKSAIEHRCRTLGISRMATRPLSTSEVGRLFGISRETVLQRFVNPGRLVGQKRTGGPHGFLWFFTRADVERLIREHPDAYDVLALRDPSLRALAQAVARRRSALTTREASALAGVAQRSLLGWLARGLVPSARRVRGVRPGAGGAWLIDAAALDTIKALPAVLAERRNLASATRRDPLTGVFMAAAASSER